MLKERVQLTHDLCLVVELVALLLKVCGLEFTFRDLLLDVVGKARELVGDDAVDLLLVEVEEGADLRETQLHPLSLHP